MPGIAQDIDVDSPARQDPREANADPRIGKVAARFVEDMILGMLLARSVRLTEIARALDEPIPLHSTHKRAGLDLDKPIPA